jgi:hypothetical protein
MSIDLTYHVEMKLKGKWHHYNTGHTFRSYNFFDFIAGIENKSLAKFPLKGLPEDLSEVTALNKKNDKGMVFHPTWFTPNELKHVIESFSKFVPNTKESDLVELSFRYLFGNTIWGFDESKEDYPEEIEDVRVVCWFDGEN